MPSNHLILCHSLLLPSIFPSIRIFSNELALCIRWPNYWSFSFSINPSSEYSGLSYLGLTGLISLKPKGFSRVFSSTKIWKCQFFGGSAFSMVQLSRLYMTTGKVIALTRWTFVRKVMSLLFNMLSKFVIAFLPRSKRLSSFQFHGCSHHVQWFWSPKNKVAHCFHCFPNYLPWSDGTRCHDLSFRCWVLSQLFHSPLSLSSRDSLVLLLFLPWGWCHLHIWGYWYFSQQSWFQLDSWFQSWFQPNISHDVLCI